MFDLIVRNATLPDGRTGLDIGIRDGRIAAIERDHRGRSRPRDRRAGLPRRAALRRHPFPHGRDAVARHSAAQPVGHAARRHRAVGRAEAAADGRGGRRARIALLRSRGVARAAGDPQPCRHLRRPAHRGRCAARREEADRALYRPAARGVSAGRLFPLRQCGEEPGARARQGRRRGRRHPAFRAHHGGRRAFDRGAVRHRGRARPDGRHALRRDRRSAVAPHRDARPPKRSGAACRAASPARISPRCTAWTTIMSRSCCR